VEGRLLKGELQALGKGIPLPDGEFAAAGVVMEKTNRKSSWVRMTITDGRNRVIRRAFEFIGHPVVRLVRIAVADIHLGSLSPGNWRLLTPREMDRLRTWMGGRKSEKLS